jgi:hypothetical protein
MRGKQRRGAEAQSDHSPHPSGATAVALPAPRHCEERAQPATKQSRRPRHADEIVSGAACPRNDGLWERHTLGSQCAPLSASLRRSRSKSASVWARFPAGASRKVSARCRIRTGLACHPEARGSGAGVFPNWERSLLAALVGMTGCWRRSSFSAPLRLCVEMGGWAAPRLLVPAVRLRAMPALRLRASAFNGWAGGSAPLR